MSEKPEEKSREIIDQLLAGATLTGVEIQTARCSEGLPDSLKARACLFDPLRRWVNVPLRDHNAGMACQFLNREGVRSSLPQSR